MALLKCTECGHDVSEYADKCPNCGCPIEIIKKNIKSKVENIKYRRVILKNPGSGKVKVIKCVREITSLGLKEAKELVDTAPNVIAEGVTEQDAINLEKMFESEGAEIVIELDENSMIRNDVFAKLRERKTSSTSSYSSTTTKTQPIIQETKPLVHCPYCNSTNVNKISGTKKAASIIGFGILSNKIGKQWHCNSCKSDF